MAYVPFVRGVGNKYLPRAPRHLAAHMTTAVRRATQRLARITSFFASCLLTIRAL